jgi:hypothetical protein
VGLDYCDKWRAHIRKRKPRDTGGRLTSTIHYTHNLYDVFRCLRQSAPAWCQSATTLPEPWNRRISIWLVRFTIGRDIYFLLFRALFVYLPPRGVPRPRILVFIFVCIVITPMCQLSSLIIGISEKNFVLVSVRIGCTPRISLIPNLIDRTYGSSCLVQQCLSYLPQILHQVLIFCGFWGCPWSLRVKLSNGFMKREGKHVLNILILTAFDDAHSIVIGRPQGWVFL